VGVAGVKFYYDSTNQIGSEDTSSSYGVSWDTTGVSDGSHTLIAVSRDDAGNVATSTAITVTVDNSVDLVPPVVEMTVPTDGSTVGGSSVTLTASSTDDRSVAGVQFKVDGANIGSEDVEAPFSITWDSTAVADGSHSVVAVARDAAGNTATSTAVSVTVDNTNTAISNVSANVTGTEVEVTWSTTDASTSYVEYGFTSSYMASTTVDSDLVTSHSVTFSGLIPGQTYHYRVASADAADNVAYSSDFTFTAEDDVIATIAPSVSWDGTIDSAGVPPTDPARTTFKPTAHFTIPPYQDVTADFDVPVMAFAKGGIEKVRFYVEGNTVDVTAPMRYTGHEGNPYEAYVVRLDASEFPDQDGAFRVYAEVYPNDVTAQRRVISLDLWFNDGGTLTGSGVTAYVDSRATLATASPISVTAGNRLVGQTSGTMAIVVTNASSSTSLVVSPMSLDGGTTQPQFTDGETINEVAPDGTSTGNTSTVSGALSYNGTTGTYPTVGTVNNPFWHLKAAGAAITSAGHVSYHRATYYFKDGSYSLLGLTGQTGDYQYANLFAAAGASPTLDYGLDSSFRMSGVDQHIRGFTFREPHTFTDSSTNSNYTSGADEEVSWFDDILVQGDAPNTPVMGFPANGTVDYFTDSTIMNAAQGFASSELVRNASVSNTTSDIYSHTRAVIHGTANNIEQISPSHTDVYQFETQDNAENILIYGLRIIDPVVMNAGLFLTGEDGSGKGSFRDWAVINYLSEENRDDVVNDVDHFNFWNGTMVNTSLDLGLGTSTSAQHSSFRNNWVNRLTFDSAGEETEWLDTTIFDSNNYSSDTVDTPGTAVSNLESAQSFVDSATNDYSPSGSMPTVPRLTLLDVDGNYRAPLTALGAIADPSEYPEDDGELDPDTTGPVISSISVTPSSTSALVTWNTDEASDSLVNFSPYATFIASTTLDTTLVTSHSVTVSSLAACTQYYYRVRSADGDANVTFSSSGTFTTTGCTANSSVLDEDVEAITSSGGSSSLMSAGTGLGLDVPASFKSGVSEAYFQIKQLVTNTFLASVDEPTGTSLVPGYIYNLVALSDASTRITSFDAPLSVTMVYEDGDLGDIDESTLSIYRYDGSSWNELASCVRDTVSNTVSCTTTQFSDFGLFGQEGEDDDGEEPEEDEDEDTRRAPSGRKYGCKDPSALNYEEFVASDASLCKYSSSSEPGVSTYVFGRDLEVGMTGDDVRELQRLLNALGFVIAQQGPGSAGQETDLFGGLTREALIRFQQSHGIAPAVGYFGPLTREKINSLQSVSGNSVVTVTDTVAPAEIPVVASGLFLRDLEVGMTGEDVRALQDFLIKQNTGTASQKLSENGASGYFGELTKAALVEFQQARGISPASGYFGPVTRSAVGI
jgi:peptidoglycan hydrolase-like protein with peptidoglycan-binding domain